jgi:hypothetical protein
MGRSADNKVESVQKQHWGCRQYVAMELHKTTKQHRPKDDNLKVQCHRLNYLLWSYFLELRASFPHVTNSDHFHNRDFHKKHNISSLQEPLSKFSLVFFAPLHILSLKMGSQIVIHMRSLMFHKTYNNKQWIGKYMEGIGYGLFWSTLFQQLPWGTEKNHKKSQLKESVSQLRSGQWISQTQVRSVNAWSNFLCRWYGS